MGALECNAKESPRSPDKKMATGKEVLNKTGFEIQTRRFLGYGILGGPRGTGDGVRNHVHFVLTSQLERGGD